MKEAEEDNQQLIVLCRKKQAVHLNLVSKYKLYEIVSGGIKLYGFLPSGEEVLIDVAIAGDFIGRFDHNYSDYEEFVVALVDTQIRIHHLMNQSAENMLIEPIMMRYLASLSERLFRQQCRLLNNSSSSANLRLSYVYRLYDLQFEDSSRNKFRLIDLLSYKDIGNLSGVARQTVKKYSLQFRPVPQS